MTDQMNESTLDAMRGPEGPKVVVPVADDVVVEKIEGDRVTFAAPAPHVDSYAEATTRAMQAAFSAKAKNDAEARESLAAQRASGPKTLTHNEEAKQKADAFRRSMNGYLGHIREAELARGVDPKLATSLLPEPKPAVQDETPTAEPGPVVIEVLDNQSAMAKPFDIGRPVIADSNGKGIRLA